MRRLLRIFSATAAVLLLTLWSAITVCWLRSYSASSVVAWVWPHGTASQFYDYVMVSRGRIGIALAEIPPFKPEGLRFSTIAPADFEAYWLRPNMNRVGFRYWDRGNQTLRTAPCWIISLVTGIYPLSWCWRWWVRHRRHSSRGFAVLQDK